MLRKGLKYTTIGFYTGFVIQSVILNKGKGYLSVSSERRISKRITAGYNAEIMYEGGVYPGVIDNLSGTGACLTTFPITSPVEFKTATNIDIKFQAPNGDTIDIACSIAWAYKVSPRSLTYRLGLAMKNADWDENSVFL